MSKLGTCRFAFRISEAWQIEADGMAPKFRCLPEDLPPHIDPGSDAAREYMGFTRKPDVEDCYLCAWLPCSAPQMPPPVKRSAGGGSPLRASDCDACPFYEPPQVDIPGVRSA